MAAGIVYGGRRQGDGVITVRALFCGSSYVPALYTCQTKEHSERRYRSIQSKIAC